jgi:hypothetical protein
MTCRSVDEALSRAGEFLRAHGCSYFRIVDQDGAIIHDEGRIRAAHGALRKDKNGGRETAA